MKKVKFLKNHLNHKAADVVDIEDGIATYLERVGVVRMHVLPSPEEFKSIVETNKKVSKKVSKKKTKKVKAD